MPIARRDAAGQRAVAAVTQVVNARNQLVGNGGLSAHDDRHRQPVRVRGRDHRRPIPTRRWSGPIASSQFMFMRARYQFTQSRDRRDAVFRQPDQRLGRGRHHRQQPGPGELGPAGAARSRAASGIARDRADYARNDSRTHGGTVEIFRSRGRHNFTFGGGIRGAAARRPRRSRTRAAASRSPARPPAPTSPTSCWACRKRARSRSATPTSTCARTRTTPTSPTTGGCRRSLTRERSACAGSTSRRSPSAATAW